MHRSTALRSLVALAAGGAALARFVPATASETTSLRPTIVAPIYMAPKLAAPVPIVITDGRKGQLTAQVLNGKTAHYLTLNGKPAAQGSYACANGKHITVSGPNGLVEESSISWAMLNPQPLPP